MDNYNNDSLYSFNFEGIYEGTVIEVYEDNSCLINIPKLLIGQNDNNKIEGVENITNNNIINSFMNKSTIKIVNGVICYPYERNNSSIKMEVGNKVSVFFIDGDPNKAFYTDLSYNSNKDYSKDIIYSKGNISIYIENNEIVFKNKNNMLKIKEEGIEKIIEEGSENDNVSIEEE